MEEIENRRRLCARLRRWTLETLGALETTKCVLEDDFEKEEEREENEQLDGLDNGADERDYCHERSPARDRDRDRRRDSHRYRDHDYDREYGHGRERETGTRIGIAIA